MLMYLKYSGPDVATAVIITASIGVHVKISEESHPVEIGV